MTRWTSLQTPAKGVQWWRWCTSGGRLFQTWGPATGKALSPTVDQLDCGWMRPLEPHDHATTTLRHLHWLPVQCRITYKLCLHMCIHIHKAPSYLIDIVTALHQSVLVAGFGPSAVPATSSHAWDSILVSAVFICCTSRLEQSTAITATAH